VQRRSAHRWATPQIEGVEPEENGMTKRDAVDSQERREQANTLIEEGRAMLDRGEIDAAIKTFDEATGLDEFNAAAWNDLAVALFQKGEQELAIGCLYTALKVDPTFADAAINLATLLEQAGRATDGIPGLRGVLFHDPDHEDVRECLERLGVTRPRPVALVVIDPDADKARVVEACLTEWNHLVVRPDHAILAAGGDADTPETWTGWLAGLRPDTIVIDPEHPFADRVRAAAETLGARVAVLGEDLPAGEPLVDLARALTDEVPTTGLDVAPADRPAPLLSVLVQVTHIAHAINLLDRLACQDLAPGLFEVIVVDRAYGEPATSLVEGEEYGFDMTIVRAEGAGLGEARNLALEKARGRWLVFFDEESRPAPDNLSGHLRAQVATDRPTAVLGHFRMHPNLLDNSLRKLIDTTGILYAQPVLVHGTEHGGPALRANNLSVPKSEVDAVGGFDPVFSAGCEDTDLGVRLERERGVRVRYDETIDASFDYAWTVGDVQVEQLVRGWACVRLAEKHDTPDFLIDPEREVLDATWYAERRVQADEAEAQARDLCARITAMCAAEEPYRKTGAAEIIDPIIHVIGMQAFNRGVAIAAAGFRLEDERMPGSFTASPTPVWVRPGGDVAPTLESLAGTEGEIEVWLDEAPEIQIPAGLTVRIGDLRSRFEQEVPPAVAWIEAGTTAPPTWREALLGTLEAWPDHGLVLPEVPPGPAGNRPRPTPMGVVATAALAALGLDALDDLGTLAFEGRLEEAGFRILRDATVPARVGERVLDQAV
jgi:hypothetical protein